MKVKVTYIQIPGDDEIVRMFGHRFISGQSTELDSENEDDAYALSKLSGNQHFELVWEDGMDIEPPKRGRPKKLEAPKDYED